MLRLDLHFWLPECACMHTCMPTYIQKHLKLSAPVTLGELKQCWRTGKILSENATACKFIFFITARCIHFDCRSICIFIWTVLIFYFHTYSCPLSCRPTEHWLVLSVGFGNCMWLLIVFILSQCCLLGQVILIKEILISMNFYLVKWLIDWLTT